MSEITQNESALTVITTTNLIAVFTQEGGIDAILSRIKADARARAAGLDISRPRDRDEIASLARTKITGAKTAIVAAGKKLTEGWRSQTAAVNADCRRVEAELDALRDEIRAPLTQWQNAEKERVANHERALAEMEKFGNILDNWTADYIAGRIDVLQASAFTTRDWQEFGARATDAYAVALDHLRNAHAAAVNREAEAAELARLRAEEAELQRIARHEGALRQLAAFADFDEPDDALTAEQVYFAKVRFECYPEPDWEEFADRAAGMRRLVIDRLDTLHQQAQGREAAAQAEREAEIAAAAAAEATRIAEAEAACLAEIAAAQLAEAQRKAEHEAQIAAEAAARAETRRVQGHQAALDIMRRLAAPLEPPDPVPVIDAKLGQLDEVFVQRDWEEFAAEAGEVHAAAYQALTMAHKHSMRVAEEEAAKREAETIRREQERVAAREAEQRRQDGIRAANAAHKGKINREAMVDLVTALEAVRGLIAGCADAPMEAIAKAIVIALAKGEVRHCSVKY